MYADYDYYTSVYAGSLSEDDFARLSVAARRYINMITMGRACTAPESVRGDLADCMCAIVDEMYMQQQTSGADIASESNDGVSVTYRDNRGSPEQRLQGIAMQYLASTGLMYAGCL